MADRIHEALGDEELTAETARLLWQALDKLQAGDALSEEELALSAAIVASQDLGRAHGPETRAVAEAVRGLLRPNDPGNFDDTNV